MLRPRSETALAILSGALAVITTIWPRWIEALFGVDPDGGDGSVEWWLVALLALVAVGSALLARRDYRRVRAAAEPT